jgi:nucleoside-diphosphate-sugar epimerase
MKILITGASGFVGRYLIEEIITAGHTIIATSTKDSDYIKSNFSWHSEVEYISHDLNKKISNYYDFFHKPDMVIHLSWGNLPHYKELFHIEDNLPVNYHFIKNLVENGIKKVVCIGTCFEYGMLDGCLKENFETYPSTSYGLAKDTLRKFLEELQNHYSFNLKWLRLFYPYGKDQNPRSLLSQLEKAIINKEKDFNMSGGEQLRDYLPIEKVAEYIAKVSLQDKYNGIINICNGKPVSVKSFVENYVKNKNVKLRLNLGYYPYPDYEPMAFWGDNSKLKKALSSNVIDSKLR